jgi:gamma-glutamyltranspeptidase/glutathione hydrolase
MSVAARLKSASALALAAFLAACASVEAPPAPSPTPAPQAEAARPGPRGMVAAANPLAAQAGLEVLKRGGTAVDAAVAMQAVLGLVEPQSTGLGGGAFMTFYDAKTGKTLAYDGRETAPAGASPTMFLGADGKPMDFGDAILSGRSTGAPGAVAMLKMAHEAHGKLAWSSLFVDAERLADDGFKVSPRMAYMMRGDFPQTSAPDVKAYFTKPDGKLYEAGDTLKNPTYAATLRKVAAEGPKAILEGPIAEAIVKRLHEGPNPGSMTLADLAGYRPKVSEAFCKPYRVYVVCTPPLPSGGPALQLGLGLLDKTDIDAHRNDAQGWYLFSQASRLMYADRDRYMGDPAFVDVPLAGLFDPAYLVARASLIGPTAGPAPKPGSPKGAGVRAPDRTLEPGGTSHIVIVDEYGNVLSMTTTVESIYGSGRMVAGFFLNNQLTDFSLSPSDPDGAPAANAVAPGKRPRSSMAPAIVFDRAGHFVTAIGSPGGSAILAYNLKTLVGVLDWKLSVDDALELPNMIARGDSYGAEVGKFDPAVVAGLAAKGVKLGSGSGAEGSGIQGIEMTPQGLPGGADSRREGVALPLD